MMSTKKLNYFATAQPWPPNSPRVRAHFAKPGDTSATVADQIGQALQTNDIFEFKIYATALPVVVMKDVTPPSATPCEATPPPVPRNTPRSGNTTNLRVAPYG